MMSNPPFYENVRERWAVRISNNGEFIHANPEIPPAQGSSNVTNGCINLSLGDAQAYFGTALYGDPVEVTGTSIDLSPADGDIYDWAIDWPTLEVDVRLAGGLIRLEPSCRGLCSLTRRFGSALAAGQGVGPGRAPARS